ncbi:MAG: BREX protein BrxB domain-containing protein [Myxococcota bacterium]
MSSLESTFDDLMGRLDSRDPLNPANSDPFYYFVHRPAETLELKEKLAGWRGRLQNAGWTPEVVSFGKLLWDIIERSGRWDTWLEVEADTDDEDRNDAVAGVLGAPGGLVDAVAAYLAPTPGVRRIVLFTDLILLHPWFRVRTIEGLLHDRVGVPAIVFYPGRRVGRDGLSFVDIHREDSNYRCTIVGGHL